MVIDNSVRARINLENIAPAPVSQASVSVRRLCLNGVRVRMRSCSFYTRTPAISITSTQDPNGVRVRLRLRSVNAALWGYAFFRVELERAEAVAVFVVLGPRQVLRAAWQRAQRVEQTHGRLGLVRRPGFNLVVLVPQFGQVKLDQTFSRLLLRRGISRARQLALQAVNRARKGAVGTRNKLQLGITAERALSMVDARMAYVFQGSDNKRLPLLPLPGPNPRS